MPPIFSVFWAPSEDEIRIDEDLDVIRNRVTTNRRHFELFAKRVADLLKRKRMAEIRRLVADTKEKALAWDEADILTRTNIDNYDHWDEIIKSSMAQLYAMKERSERRIKADTNKEEEAIKLDKRALGVAVERSRKRESLIPVQKIMQIHYMEEPKKDPLVVPTGFLRYNEIVWFLTSTGAVAEPELWIQQDAAHKLTPSGRCWTYASGRTKIQNANTHLEVVDVANKAEYIVALVHEDAEEYPVPLDVTKHGRSCCQPPCGNLKNHLERIWKSRLVLQARVISDPEDATVLGAVLDTSLWTPRTNDLYLRCRPRPCDE